MRESIGCQDAPMFCSVPHNAGMYRTLGERLDALCKARGLSHNELARRCGISQPSISRIVANEQNPTLETVEAMARHLQATVSQLVGEAPLDVQDDAGQIMKLMQELPPYKVQMLKAAAESLSKDP